MEFNDLNVLVALKQILLQTPYAKENGAKTHVLIRCPICGDSRKHHDATHCYVNIEGNKPVSYYCFKCSEGHFVSSSFLRSLNITDMNLIGAVWKYNKTFLGNSKATGKFIIKAQKRDIIPVYDKCVHEAKLRYVENRLGVELKYEDLPRFKIILSLEDFITMNALPLNTKSGMAYYLERDYVGFLSADTSYIVFRNTKEDKYRYVNYPVFSNSDKWGSKAYILPSQFDIMANDIEFNVTEGVFDILGCYFNIKNQESKNTLYGAVNGAGYLGFIRKVLSLGFIDNLNINIYSDRDKSVGWYRSMDELKNLYKSLSIWYNHYPGQKDIGVPKEFIDVRKIKLTGRKNY